MPPNFYNTSLQPDPHLTKNKQEKQKTKQQHTLSFCDILTSVSTHVYGFDRQKSVMILNVYNNQKKKGRGAGAGNIFRIVPPPHPFYIKC